MKATKFRFFTVFMASLLLLLSVSCFSSCGSRNTAKFEFELKDAKVEYSEVLGVPYATVTVMTTCVSGRFYDKEYPHNVEGGKPWMLDGEIAREGQAEVNAMTTELDIRKGDVIEYTWTFDIPRDFAEGDYDIRVEWFGSEQIFHGVCFHSHAEE
jgi:hypothetical protein